MIPYIIWDSLVTGSHWWFNEEYTLNFSLAGLPIGEWLFFIAIPFSCLFVWEVVSSCSGNHISSRLQSIRFSLIFAIPVGISVCSIGKEYTGIVLIFLGIVAVLDWALKTHLLLKSKTYLYLGVVTVLTLIFNGYLTSRPVVLYGSPYQLGFRIATIPVEDFGYGYTLILLCTILYEKLKGFIRA